MVIDTQQRIGLFRQILGELARRTPKQLMHKLMMPENLWPRTTYVFGRAVRMCEALFDRGQLIF